MIFETASQSRKSYWKAVSDGDKFKFQSAFNGKYLSGNDGVSSTSMSFSVNECTDVSGTFHLNANLSGVGVRNVATWASESGNSGFGKYGSNGCYGGGHNNTNWTTDYLIEEVNFDEETSVVVTYTVKMGEKTLGTILHEETRGSAPTIASVVPSYVTLSELPGTITTNAYTIQSSYKEGMPFEVGTKCYKIDLNEGVYFIYANNSANNVKEAKSFSDNHDYKWQVGGNWVTGFTFRNLSGYYIAAPSKIPSNGANTTVPTSITELCYFDMEQNGTSGYRFKPHGGSNYLAHTSANALNLQFFDYYRRDKKYNTGNTLTFTKVDRANAADVTELQTKINALYTPLVGPLTSNSIGYPKKTSTTAQNLSVYSGTAVTIANYEAALDAYNALLSESDINLPTPGKAYHIAFVANNGTDKKYIQNSGNAGEVSTAAKFVCGKDGDKFIFVLTDGTKFMNYQGANTDLASYATSYNSFTIQPLAASTSGNLGNSTAADRFGYVYLTSEKRSSSSNSAGCMLVNQNSGAYDNSTAPFFNGTLTSAITFEQVADEVRVKLTNPNSEGTSGLDGKYVGTFSAPYHVALPEGVKAYTAAVEGATVNFAELGTTIPANTGVLLYAEGASKDVNELTVPVGTATAVTSNALKPANGEIAAGTYVLGNGSNGVGFYARQTSTTVANKAYLDTNGTEVRNFRFDFEEPTTGVESLMSEQPSGMAFDLAGRRINANAKGISIVNGKKYIK